MLYYLLYKFSKIINYRYIEWKCDYWQKQGVRTDSVGLYTRFMKSSYDWERDLYVRNGKCFGIYELGKPVLYLSDPELIREVLVKDFHIFTNRRVSHLCYIFDTIFKIIYSKAKVKYSVIIQLYFRENRLKIGLSVKILFNFCLRKVDFSKVLCFIQF